MKVYLPYVARWSVYGLYAYNAVREQNWVTPLYVYSTSQAESLPSFLLSKHGIIKKTEAVAVAAAAGEISRA